MTQKSLACLIFKIFSDLLCQLLQHVPWSYFCNHDGPFLDPPPTGGEWWLVRVKLAMLPVSWTKQGKNLWHCDCLIWHSGHIVCSPDPELLFVVSPLVKPKVLGGMSYSLSAFRPGLWNVNDSWDQFYSFQEVAIDTAGPLDDGTESIGDVPSLSEEIAGNFLNKWILIIEAWTLTKCV